MRVAVVGWGWVGKSMHRLFPESYIYDLPLKMGYQKEVNTRDVAFICVPTPNMEDGRLDTSIVETVVQWCKCPLIIIRSTMNPGDTYNLTRKYGKKIVYQPEYLGETPDHPLLDPKERKFIILGGERSSTRTAVELYTTVYNADVSIRQVTSLESEVIKLSENRAIMYKVLECQELYDACELHDVDYYTVRDAVYGDDPRFNLWWTFIYPDKRGANSKCIPKDVYAWAAWAETCPLTTAALEYNEELING